MSVVYVLVYICNYSKTIQSQVTLSMFIHYLLILVCPAWLLEQMKVHVSVYK